MRERRVPPGGKHASHQVTITLDGLYDCSARVTISVAADI
jgi:hypothetical protein